MNDEPKPHVFTMRMTDKDLAQFNQIFTLSGDSDMLLMARKAFYLYKLYVDALNFGGKFIHESSNGMQKEVILPNE